MSVSFATEKQINYILSLESQRDSSALNPVMVDYVNGVKMGYPETINKKAASRIIELFLEAPRKPLEMPQNVCEVSDGRYAIEVDGKLRFFHVNTPEFGRWIGHTFVKEQFGGDLEPVRNKKFRETILSMIEKDEDSAARYGQELGICGRCGRELTTAESRAIGIGPVCLSK